MSSYEDESDMELPITKTSGNKNKELIKYMKEMDQELSNTTIGKSFETKTKLVSFFFFT